MCRLRIAESKIGLPCERLKAYDLSLQGKKLVINAYFCLYLLLHQRNVKELPVLMMMYEFLLQPCHSANLKNIISVTLLFQSHKHSYSEQISTEVRHLNQIRQTPARRTDVDCNLNFSHFCQINSTIELKKRKQSGFKIY